MNFYFVFNTIRAEKQHISVFMHEAFAKAKEKMTYFFFGEIVLDEDCIGGLLFNLLKDSVEGLEILRDRADLFKGRFKAGRFCNEKDIEIIGQFIFPCE